MRARVCWLVRFPGIRILVRTIYQPQPLRWMLVVRMVLPSETFTVTASRSSGKFPERTAYSTPSGLTPYLADSPSKALFCHKRLSSAGTLKTLSNGWTCSDVANLMDGVSSAAEI